MEKWADYLITGVRYDKDQTYIDYVKVREDKGEKAGSEDIIYKRETIVKAIDDGETFITSYFDKEKNGWKRGAIVSIIEIDKIKYLRSDKNKTKKDNLENLPEI